MSDCGESIRVMHPLFQEGQGGSIPTSPLDLHFYACDVDTAITLNRLWHSRLPRVVRSNITRNPLVACYAAEWGGVWFASAIWTNPTARFLPYHDWLELRRFAIAADAPKNTASRMIAWMVREIRRRFPKVVNLISYQDCDVHTGCIYRAAGWTPTAKSFDHRDRGLRSGRARNRSQTTATKQRWEKQLKQQPQAPATEEGNHK
jgi:hypothetical protein